MLGTLYTVGALFGIVLIMAFAYPFVLAVASLPGTFIYATSRKPMTGTVVGSVFTFALQFYVYAGISAYIATMARYMISEHGGWKWVIWPMAFVGTVITLASGMRDAIKEEKANPELKLHPMYLPLGWSTMLACAMFIVFAIFPGAVWPLWAWLPGL